MVLYIEGGMYGRRRSHASVRCVWRTGLGGRRDEPGQGPGGEDVRCRHDGIPIPAVVRYRRRPGAGGSTFRDDLSGYRADHRLEIFRDSIPWPKVADHRPAVVWRASLISEVRHHHHFSRFIQWVSQRIPDFQGAKKAPYFHSHALFTEVDH